MAVLTGDQKIGTRKLTEGGTIYAGWSHCWDGLSDPASIGGDSLPVPSFRARRRYALTAPAVFDGFASGSSLGDALKISGMAVNDRHFQTVIPSEARDLFCFA